MKETNRLAPVDHGDATAQMTPGTLVSRLAVLDMAGLRRVLMYAWGACPSSVESALADDRAEQLRKAARATKPCPAPGCGHPKASHWEHNAASGGRVGCAILGCRCARYADPAEPERSAAPVIAPCPDAVVHGPCSRLAGHPVPHRTLAGHEWDDSPAAAVPVTPAAGPPQGYLALAAPTLAASLAVPGKAAGDDGALEDAAAQDEDPADDPFMPAAGDEDPDEADGFAAAERRADEVTGSQERDGSRVAR